LGTYTRTAIASLKEVAVINAVNFVVSLIALTLLRIVFTDVFGLILLLEGAVLWLIGGALGLSGQPSMSTARMLLVRRFFGQKEAQTTSTRVRGEKIGAAVAALYVLTGAILFLESASLGALFR
jgi:hypothetical protein